MEEVDHWGVDLEIYILTQIPVFSLLPVVSRCKQQTLMPPATAMRCSCHQAFSATTGCAPLNQEAQQTADCLLLLRHLVAVIKDNVQ